jgi:hypothetical protein
MLGLVDWRGEIVIKRTRTNASTKAARDGGATGLKFVGGE